MKKVALLCFAASLLTASDAFQSPLDGSARRIPISTSSHPSIRQQLQSLSFKNQDGINLHYFSSTTTLTSTATDGVDQIPPNQDTSDETLKYTHTIEEESTSLKTLNNNTISYPPTPSFRECLAFALPALGIYICPPLMSLIDASFIGRLSTSLELAALGPASTISDSAPLPLLFLSIAATNLIAKSVAQKDHQASARVSRTALGMGTICGTILAFLVAALAKPLSILYCGGASASAEQLLLATACAKYVAIRAFALPAVVITTIAQAICIGTKDTKTPMISVALAAVCNLLGDLILVKGFGQGIAGAAWATSLSQVVAAGLLLRVLKTRGFLTKDQNQTTSTIDTVKQLLSFIPFLFIMTVKIGWHNSCTATAASLGGVQAAAHTALLSVAMVCMVLGDVGSSLSQAFLPAFEGSEPAIASPINTKKRSSKQSTIPTFDLEAAMPTIRQLLKCTVSISATVATFAATAIGVFGGQITNDPLVVAEMRNTLPWILATLCFHGSAVTLEGLLLSRKMFQPLSACYTILAVTVAAFQIATRRFGLGLAGVWACYVWFCASRVVTFSTLGGLLRPRRWIQRFRREQAEVTYQSPLD